MDKKLTFERLIIWLMFALIPIDMLHGFLLHSGVILPLSVGQLFKLLLLGSLLLSFITEKNRLVICFLLFLLLFIPSLIQVFFQLKIDFLFKDFIKISRYLMPIIAYLFFKKITCKGKKGDMNLIFKLVQFSYAVFSFNILLKYIGLGYAMYPNGDIGSKGFFFAGNETSALLIILSAIIGFNIAQKGKNLKYSLFFIFNLFIGLTISSKTGTLGVLLVFLLIPVKKFKFKIRLKYLKRVIISVLVILPIVIISTWKFIVASPVFKRLDYFWKELDFLTFIFSNRNNFFKSAWQVYLEEYNILEKFFGVGQTTYELLNGNSIVEIDIADIFFSYGIIGLSLFIFLMIFGYYQAKKLRVTNNYPYAGLVILMLFVLFGISTIAGHVYSSGMSAVFIGLLFSLMFYKKNLNVI
ncbi:O-antigen ligase-like membrane protein [Maribacter caenipelagi]|uniref:O-antigen ligase-like membrane protein n=1 Tax=Maribacter caenipelagi TaxID=1447781 RepID=A0A4R7DBV5_9FLAO|nr:O-antigen ligase family protein [Maribacter caenipelagi]TDS18650.1 O-antigen ligase-like membrane protein [Maribacter caenipelagi]